MKRFATEGWWIGTLSLLIVSNLILLYWICTAYFGWENGYAFGDFLYYLAFFPGLVIAPMGALFGFLTAVDFATVGNRGRSAVLAFLSGGAAICAYICWNAILTGGR
ncbi:MAG: hypothetical protein QOJ65_1335 [Fimbriimonadaceae bacterium]|jgi:hypothetical protein|nr:hypothetical protein [Fimbriimonadaceae bacterium]